MMSEQIMQAVKEQRDLLLEMADYIHDNPEIGLQEYKACTILANYLRKEGFETQIEIGGLPTAFRAEWKNGEGGPRIGLLCEYDALEGIGHGCSHHIQGPAILGAAVALKRAIPSDRPCSVIVYGTPAEETAGGKITMMKNGCFRDIDVALMMHASAKGTSVDISTMALTTYNVAFTGKGAHAAIRPEMGRSALDALLLTFNAIEFLREHVPDDVRIHYAVTDGGMPANAVPAHAAGQIIVRSFDRRELDSVLLRLDKILQGAALMTETSYSVEKGPDLDNGIPVESLRRVLMKNAEKVGAPQLAPPRTKAGSTDFGNISHVLPGACIRISTDCGIPAAGHSIEAAAQGKNEEHHNAIIFAAEILALSSMDMILDPLLLERMKEEFRQKSES